MASVLRHEYFVTVEDYLSGERFAQEKHEYLAGVVYAMAGTSIGHDRIAGNIARDLGNQLRGKPCEVFSSDVKVRIQSKEAEFFYYPDVTVDCSGAGNASLFAEEPRVIFEVLSPDTERTDRAEKLPNYQTLPSLEACVLVDQFRVAVMVCRRTADGWSNEFLTDPDLDSGAVDLPGIGCRVPLSAIYERTGLVS